MATFYLHMEEVTPISSTIIETLQATPGVTDVKAIMTCLRHTRFKSKTTPPHYYVTFRQEGRTYREDANTPAELDALITEYF